MEIGIIKPTDIRKEMQTAYLDYAMSVITSRALPDIRDGLKPVQRRILYAMHEMALRHNVPFKKCARIVGEVLGKYHPHGDQAVYDALVRMAQDFTMRYRLIDGQGNFGCFTGDTKIKLLDGTEKSFKELAELPANEVFYVYSVDNNGQIVAGEGRHARVTRRKAKLVEVTLDNGATMRCTPDHRFMLRDASYKQAQDLTPDDSLMPGYFDTAPIKDGLNDYLRVVQPSTGEYEFVHHIADRLNHKRGLARLIKGAFVRHHKNFNRFDNRPSNLERMEFLEHLHLHAEQIETLWQDGDFRATQREGVKRYYAEHPEVREERRLRFTSQNRDADFRKANGRRIADSLKEHFDDPNVRAEISTRMKTLWADPDYRAKMSKALKGVEKRELTPAEKQRVAKIISEKSRAMWQDGGKRTEIIEAISRAMASTEIRAELSENAKRLWQDPAYRAKFGEDHFSKMAHALWSEPGAKEKHRLDWAERRADEGFRRAQRQAVQASNARRMAENPDLMAALTSKAKTSLVRKWSDPGYQQQVMRQRIAGYVSQLIQEFGHEQCTPELYEAQRDANWIPHFSTAIQYFQSFDELLDFAAKRIHRVLQVRWLDQREDVYDITVDEHHNFLLTSGVFVHNSIDGDPPAHMRYTEARLTELAEELLLDIDKDTVAFYPNFDETLKQPGVLPGKVPNLLINGANGIAVGMATLIPPHNLGEICDAINYLIEHWNKVDEIEPDHLMQFVKGPDFPTGGIILGADGIKEAYATGKGRIVVRGKIHGEQISGGRNRIIVSEIPYQINKTSLIERIAELVRDKRIEEIGDLRDESDRQGMSIVIELKRGIETTPVINQLLKHTTLQSGFSINMLALVDGEPRVVSLKRALQLFVQHRQVVITRRTQYELERAKLRAHILEGLKIALDNLDEVIRTIRQSPDADTARERLMKRFKLSELQATAILDMQLRRLAALERKKIEDELAEVRKRIKYFEELLRSPKKILGVIQEECSDLKERFGDARRTFIAQTAETEFKEMTHAEEGEALVTLSRDGVIRRAPTLQYRRTRSDARNGVQAREDDPTASMLIAGNTDSLALFTTRGRVLPLRMSQVPDVTRNPSGLSLANQLESGERFTGITAFGGDGANAFMTLATTGGKIKRTALQEFMGIPAGGTRAINLSEGDELGWATVTRGGGEFLVVTAQGQALRFAEDEVPVQGRVAGGVWAIKLAEGDRVAAVEIVDPDAWLVVSTANGVAKRVALKDFPTKGRHTGGVTVLATDSKTGPIASARIVALEEDVVLIAQSGLNVRVRAENIAKGARAARGKQFITLKEGDAITRLTSLVGKVESEAAATQAEAPDSEKESQEPEPNASQKVPERAVVKKMDVPSTRTARGNGHGNGSENKSKASRVEQDGRDKDTNTVSAAKHPPRALKAAKRIAKQVTTRTKQVKPSETSRKPPAKASKTATRVVEQEQGENADEEIEQIELPLASFKPLPKKR